MHAPILMLAYLIFVSKEDTVAWNTCIYLGMYGGLNHTPSYEWVGRWVCERMSEWLS